MFEQFNYSQLGPEGLSKQISVQLEHFNNIDLCFDAANIAIRFPLPRVFSKGNVKACLQREQNEGS